MVDINIFDKLPVKDRLDKVKDDVIQIAYSGVDIPAEALVDMVQEIHRVLYYPYGSMDGLWESFDAAIHDMIDHLTKDDLVSNFGHEFDIHDVISLASLDIQYLVEVGMVVDFYAGKRLAKYGMSAGSWDLLPCDWALDADENVYSGVWDIVFPEEISIAVDTFMMEAVAYSTYDEILSTAMVTVRNMLENNVSGTISLSSASYPFELDVLPRTKPLFPGLNVSMYFNKEVSLIYIDKDIEEAIDDLVESGDIKEGELKWDLYNGGGSLSVNKNVIDRMEGLNFFRNVMIKEVIE